MFVYRKPKLADDYPVDYEQDTKLKDKFATNVSILQSTYCYS